MHADPRNSEENRADGAEPRGTRRFNLSIGLAGSVLLHGAILAGFIIVLYETAPSHVFNIIPVNIAQLSAKTAGPPAPDNAPTPLQPAAVASSPAIKSAALAPQPTQPAPDDLERKLERLAKLREPPIETHVQHQDFGLSDRSAMRNDAADAGSATLKDFLRGQIERHWAPDLGLLKGGDISVLVRVEMSDTGVVTNAEVLRNPRAADTGAYEEVALSARNAVLLSSPFTLPPGHYARKMSLVLNLNTADAMR